jgi:hypothetical protein
MAGGRTLPTYHIYGTRTTTTTTFNLLYIQADRAFGSFTDRLSVGLLYYYILFIIVVYVLLRI